MTATTHAKDSFIIDAKAIKQAAGIYRAINHSLRLQIIEIIHKAGKINVTPIIEQLKLEQPVVSAHLKILRDAKIVNSERKGSSVFYSINYSEIHRISMLAEKLIPYKTNTPGFLSNSNRNFVIKFKKETVTFIPIELEIIHLICEENSEEEIAERLDIKKETVEDHKSSIIKKMKVRSSVGILFYAIKTGLFKA